MGLSKQAWRDHFAQAQPTVRDQETGRLEAALEGLVTDRGFEVVLTTLPMGAEPDLGAALTRLLSRGVRVALARTGPARSLQFHFVTSMDGPWDLHPFGMREPPASLPRWSPGPRTLCLVPGVAFAPLASGRWARLGHGGGYYDRWLAAHGEAVVTYGVAWGDQVVDELPLEPHDVPLDGLLGR